MKFPKKPTIEVKKATTEKRAASHRGPLGKAKVLTKDQFEKAAEVALQDSMFGLRDRLFILLSRYGGMRSAEIAALHVEDFTDATGKAIPELHVSKRGAKYGKERTIDIPEVLVQALDEYRTKAGIKGGRMFYSYRSEPCSPNAVRKQIKATYEKCGYKGARSHSGRRYAITTLAQTINLDGGSLEDVRIFAGHSDLKTTAGYIEKSPHGKKMAARL